mmetsp:Transcript_24061/g.35305  ORF Transcript_24061/g.35305 Transcript_24061/m.35305 type:complete len:209 (-) Transcript_24061:1314-1940(-)
MSTSNVSDLFLGALINTFQIDTSTNIGIASTKRLNAYRMTSSGSVSFLTGNVFTSFRAATTFEANIERPSCIPKSRMLAMVPSSIISRVSNPLTSFNGPKGLSLQSGSLRFFNVSSVGFFLFSRRYTECGSLSVPDMTIMPTTTSLPTMRGKTQAPMGASVAARVAIDSQRPRRSTTETSFEIDSNETIAAWENPLFQSTPATRLYPR